MVEGVKEHVGCGGGGEQDHGRSRTRCEGSQANSEMEMECWQEQWRGGSTDCGEEKKIKDGNISMNDSKTPPPL